MVHNVFCTINIPIKTGSDEAIIAKIIADFYYLNGRNSKNKIKPMAHRPTQSTPLTRTIVCVSGRLLLKKVIRIAQKLSQIIVKNTSLRPFKSLSLGSTSSPMIQPTVQN
jgi:hypothetical protein